MCLQNHSLVVDHARQPPPAQHLSPAADQKQTCWQFYRNLKFPIVFFPSCLILLLCLTLPYKMIREGMKRKTHFHFKQFSVRHDRCTMKVGTDAVLLGSWAMCHDAKSILDIGTGSGVIALMAAQRTQWIQKLTLLKLKSKMQNRQAKMLLNSPWPTKVSVHHRSCSGLFSTAPIRCNY